MKKFIPLFAALLFFVLALPAFADDAITVKKQNLTFDFPKSMTFTLDASGPAEIQKATLVVEFPTVTRRVEAKLQAAQDIHAVVEWNLDSDNSASNGGYVPPGVTASYTWILEDAAGNKVETEPQTFTVEDNRIPWQTVENQDLAIHWYDAGKSFGTSVFDAGVETLKQVREELGAGAGGKVHIWFYSDRSDFQTSMPDMNVWTGGRSFGEYRVIILLNEPVDVSEAIRGARHELTHQVIFDSLGGGLARQALPHWFNEGLATYNESGDKSLLSFLEHPLNEAIANDTLPTLKSREANFPPDSNEALVSYALSYSIVKMLFEKFGQAKVHEMYQLFQQGIPSDETFTRVFGMDTNGLDNLYRKSVGLNERDFSNSGLPTPRAQPTFSFSSAETPAPKGQATPTPQAVSVVNTPAPASATTVPQNSNNANNTASTSLCGIGGGIALALFGAYAWRKRHGATQL